MASNSRFTYTGMPVGYGQPAAFRDLPEGISNQRAPGYSRETALANAIAGPNPLAGLPQRGGGSGPGIAGTIGSLGGGLAGGALGGAKIGGLFGGPIGAVAGSALGGLVGAIGRTARSAPTDYSVPNASTAVTRAYNQYLGRDPEPGAVATHLSNQGLKSGDRWVGSAGLGSVIDAIANSPEAQQRTALNTAITGPAANTTPTSGAWGLSPSGQRVEIGNYTLPEGPYSAGAFRGQLEGFNADKFDPAHPEGLSLKMIVGREMEHVDVNDPNAVAILADRLRARGINVEVQGTHGDLLHFLDTGEVVDVMRNAGRVGGDPNATLGWAWMPTWADGGGGAPTSAVVGPPGDFAGESIPADLEGSTAWLQKILEELAMRNVLKTARGRTEF